MPSSEPNMSDASPQGVAPESHVPLGADYASDRDFVDFPISTETIQGIHGLGYRTATPVQAATIEPALAGRDLLVRAKTGTGKTVAFLVPMIERITMGERGPRMLVLAPTRELAQQTYDEAVAIAKHRDLTAALLLGGVPMGSQERALAEGASIIIGTPGRLLDHYRRKHLDLSAVGSVCLDEADEMLSMGFYEDVTSILDACPEASQKLLFSATISDQTEKIVARYLKDPENIRLSTDADNVEGIVHYLYEAPPSEHRVRSLLHLLDMEDPTSAIIFCNTREDAATVASFLDRQGLDVQLLSGELPQARRTKVMKLVKSGVVRFLVATDVAARGIDISDLSHVIQYSLPQDPAIYLHRTGRTGRIGKKGTAVSMYGATDLQTRKVLEAKHNVKFVERPFPDAAVSMDRRIAREIARIRDAVGSIVFEAQLPAARALLKEKDAEILVAAALRAFLMHDRARRAQIAQADDAVESDIVVDGRFDRSERRKDPTERPEPTERAERAERGERSGRGERSERSERSDRGERPERGRRRKSSASALDIDALLITEETSGDDGAPSGDTLELEFDAFLDVGPAEAIATADAPVEHGGGDLDEAEDGEKKKRRRRRRKKKEGDVDDILSVGEDTSPVDEPAAEASTLDDLDSLLSMD